MPSESDLLASYDAQVRTALATRRPDGVSIDWDEPLIRVTGMHQGFVNYRDLAGLDGDALDDLIARTSRRLHPDRRDGISRLERRLELAGRGPRGASQGRSRRRPILQRLGFQAVTTTTPYVWTPA
jgi:hypothetical protein